MMSIDWTTVTVATVTCNSCVTIVGFIVAGAKEARNKMKQRTIVSDTSSTTHFNHSWQKLIQEDFLCVCNSSPCTFFAFVRGYKNEMYSMNNLG